MSETRTKIVESAMDVFFRYGMRKTTMGDIASAAGVSRQTLYSLYNNKEDVFAAVIRLGGEQSIAATRAAFDKADTLEQQIDAYFDHGPIAVYDLVNQMPDAAEIADGYGGEAGKEAWRKVCAKKSELLATLFAPYADKLAEQGQTIEGYAEFVEAASAHLKHTARDRDHLITLLGSLRASVLAALT